MIVTDEHPDLKNDNSGVDKLKQACQEYIEYLKSEERHEDVDGDYENAIFETALESVYGENIWELINQLKSGK